MIPLNWCYSPFSTLLAPTAPLDGKLVGCSHPLLQCSEPLILSSPCLWSGFDIVRAFDDSDPSAQSTQSRIETAMTDDCGKGFTVCRENEIWSWFLDVEADHWRHWVRLYEWQIQIEMQIQCTELLRVQLVSHII
jgi:hypothetical protein